MFTNGIDGPGGPGGITGPRHGDSIQRPGGEPRPAPERSGEFARSIDQASISERSAEVARYREMADLHREAFGDEDRSARLDEVRKRIADGHYDRPEVMDQIAGSLTDSATSVKAGADDVDELRERSASGFYDREEVIDDTAGNLLRELLGRPRQR